MDIDLKIQSQTGTDRRTVTEVEATPAVTPETETVVNMIEKLLPTPAPPPLRAALICSDRDLLIQPGGERDWHNGSVRKINTAT